MDLAGKHCVPCRGGVAPLAGQALEEIAAQTPEWRVVEGHHLERQFEFADFKTGLEFVNQVGSVAEAEGHHPDVCLSWGKVDIRIWTHKIDGLTESDFILAAKIAQLHPNRWR